MKIASLSYAGDPRMSIGENPKKVEIIKPYDRAILNFINLH